jgi:hypothetical protein
MPLLAFVDRSTAINKQQILRHLNFRLLSQDRKSSEQFTGFHRGYHEMKA